MHGKLLFQRTAGLDEKAAVDGLVRHSHTVVRGKAIRKIARDLLGRPLQREPACDKGPEARVNCQFARLRTLRVDPSASIRSGGSVHRMSPVTGDLTTHGGSRTLEGECDLTDRNRGTYTAGDLLTLGEAQNAATAPSQIRNATP